MGPVELAGFGEAMVLFESESLQTAQSVAVHVAGAEFNVCAAAARLGLATAFCTRVGADPLGSRIDDEAARLGIGTGLIAVDPDCPTGLFLKDVNPDGQRRVFYYCSGSAASGLAGQDVARLLAAHPEVVAISGITAALGPGPRDAVLALARSGARLAFDPNFRPGLGSLAAQVDISQAILPHAAFVLLGLDEAELLFGIVSPAEVLRACPAETVLKAGPEGCYYRSDDGSIGHLPSFAPSAVDPVGAGDAFAGGYLAGRLRGATIAGAAWLGSMLAAAVVGSRGDVAGLPSATEAAGLLSHARTLG